MPVWSSRQDKNLSSDMKGGVEASLMLLCQLALDNLVQLRQFWNVVRLPCLI